MLRRSTPEMVGSPVVTGSELKQLPSSAGEATLAGEFAEPMRHFSIVLRAVKGRGSVRRLARGQRLTDVRILHERHPAISEIRLGVVQR